MSHDADRIKADVSVWAAGVRAPDFLASSSQLVDTLGRIKVNADLSLHPAFVGRDLVMLDTPGFCASSIDTPEALSIPFLAQVAIDTCDELGLERFHLSGHSMGGLTALMLAQDHRDRVLSFVNIEGNVAPEDSFLSRQIIEHPSDDANAFLTDVTERVARRSEYSSRLFARAPPLTVRATSVHPVFTSMIDLSDNSPLMDMFIGLQCPTTFVHGEPNHHLSYLDNLRGIRNTKWVRRVMRGLSSGWHPPKLA